MTDSSAEKPASFTAFGDHRDHILSRTEEAGLTARVTEETGDQWRLEIDFPNDGTVSPQTISPSAAAQLANIYFEDWEVLGHYQAIHDPSAELIEARIGLVRDMGMLLPLSEFLRLIDGFEDKSSHAPKLNTLDERIDKPVLNTSLPHKSDLPKRWRLEFAGKSADQPGVELNSGSSRLQIVASQDPSSSAAFSSGMLAALQITGVTCSGHDDALRTLEEIAWKVCFEFQITYGAPFELKARPRWETITGPPHSSTRPRITANRYRRDATALYLYGRTARAMPVYQYLAFYQAIECFFPQVVNAELVTKIRLQISDPRFNSASQEALTELATIVQAHSPKMMNERDQLKSVIEHCVDEERLARFFDESDERREFFTKSDKLRGGVVTIRPKGSDPLAAQVARRIYDIRCRVVHTKTDRGAELRSILPFTPESRNLGYDIELVQFVAEETILGAGVSP